jgi:hypothetical protein
MDVKSNDEEMVRQLLVMIGEDPEREGLQETPKRFLKAMLEYTRGYREKPEDVLKVFEDGSQGVDEMVIVRDIPVYSLCEHHLAPFFGRAYVGYVPGWSRFSRVACRCKSVSPTKSPMPWRRICSRSALPWSSNVGICAWNRAAFATPGQRRSPQLCAGRSKPMPIRVENSCI